MPRIRTYYPDHILVPGDPGGDVTPFYEFDPNDYASTAELLAASSNPSPAFCSLATGELREDGSTGGVLRQTLPGTTGVESHVNYDLTIPGASAGTTAEVWVEFWQRYTGWEAPSDDKTFFISPNTGARWETHYGLFGTRVYGGPSGMSGDYFIVSDDNIQFNIDTELWDGQWHRIRLYCRAGSSSNAAFYWATDDTIHISDTVTEIYSPFRDGENISLTMGPYFATMRLRANCDPGGTNPICDWGALRIYNEDPGWSWSI